MVSFSSPHYSSVRYVIYVRRQGIAAVDTYDTTIGCACFRPFVWFRSASRMAITPSDEEIGGRNALVRTVDTGPPATNRSPRQGPRGPPIPAEERDVSYAVLAAFCSFLIQLLVSGIFLGTVASVVVALSVAGAMRCCRVTERLDAYAAQRDRGTSFLIDAEPEETISQWRRRLQRGAYASGVLGAFLPVTYVVGLWVVDSPQVYLFSIVVYLHIMALVIFVMAASCWSRTRPPGIELALLFGTCAASFGIALFLLVAALIFAVMLFFALLPGG